MLKVMREKAKYFYVLFFIVILSFVFWGVGTMDKGKSANVVAEVGSYKISGQEYWRSYENMVRFYQDLYKDKFTDEMRNQLKERVLDSMVVNRVLLIAAQENSVSVSDEELNDAIRNDPAFQRDGRFNLNVYRNRLRLSRISPEEFETAKRQELLARKMRRLIELAAAVPPEAPQVSGSEKTAEAVRQAMTNQAKEEAVRAYVGAFQRKIRIKINRDLIS
ncbi:MAG: SurA N-terminal domain-containing protein [Candidatus Sulfobium sp.]|jgi:parvulin-like peptidyl-prolyl isomerase